MLRHFSMIHPSVGMFSGVGPVPYSGDMGDSPNPLLPAGYDIAWTIISVLLVVLVIVALVSIGRAAKRLTTTQALIWTLLTIFVPVVGPIAWLSIGRRSSPTPVRSHAD